MNSRVISVMVILAIAGTGFFLAHQFANRQIPQPPARGPGQPESPTNSPAVIGAPVIIPDSVRWLDPENTGALKPGQWTVVDVVGLWCPYCPASAAGLVDLERKHRQAGVGFITLAGTDEPGMREYAQKWSIGWPVGHSVTRTDLAALGAFNESARIPGYEAKPTLLLVGPDGRLAWTDNHSRFRHESPSATLKALDEAISKGTGKP